MPQLDQFSSLDICSVQSKEERKIFAFVFEALLCSPVKGK